MAMHKHCAFCDTFNIIIGNIHFNMTMNVKVHVERKLKENPDGQKFGFFYIKFLYCQNA